MLPVQVFNIAIKVWFCTLMTPPDWRVEPTTGLLLRRRRLVSPVYDLNGVVLNPVEHLLLEYAFIAPILPQLYDHIMSSFPFHLELNLLELPVVHLHLVLQVSYLLSLVVQLNDFV